MPQLGAKKPGNDDHWATRRFLAHRRPLDDGQFFVLETVLENEVRPADANGIAVLERMLIDALLAKPDTVRAVEVANRECPAPAFDPGVMARDPWVIENDVALRMAPDGQGI
jgi:hypothetical protein